MTSVMYAVEEHKKDGKKKEPPLTVEQHIVLLGQPIKTKRKKKIRSNKTKKEVKKPTISTVPTLGRTLHVSDMPQILTEEKIEAQLNETKEVVARLNSVVDQEAAQVKETPGQQQETPQQAPGQQVAADVKEDTLEQDTPEIKANLAEKEVSQTHDNTPEQNPDVIEESKYPQQLAIAAKPEQKAAVTKATLTPPQQKQEQQQREQQPLLQRYGRPLEIRGFYSETKTKRKGSASVGVGNGLVGAKGDGELLHHSLNKGFKAVVSPDVVHKTSWFNLLCCGSNTESYSSH
jgi:hypothetical protein